MTPFSLRAGSTIPDEIAGFPGYAENPEDSIYITYDSSLMGGTNIYSFYYYNEPTFDPSNTQNTSAMSIFINSVYIGTVQYTIEREGTFFGVSVGTDPNALQQYVGVFTEDSISGGGIYFP
jgi:hypothetical protein